MISTTRLLPTTFTFPKPADVETWKPIPSAPGYSASSEGQIRNDKSGRLLKQTLRKDGYVHLGLRVDGVTRLVLVHRAVAEAFIGPCPERQEVDHHNGNKANNRPDNLSYCTHKTNLRRAAARGQLARGAENPRSKLTPDAAREIKAAAISPGDLTRFANKYGVTVTAVRAVRANKTWAWVG
ncbi:NUMOD4 motif-containing HNH endonuclease [Paludisphaera rhizosphaerae]|uniref:NUMOD4 motif-containing HNH endonuclease n=1 Tax=Paludisphaera rhizosphaerae TaxID=2711216 RepID=UPI0013EBC147|nr:NUMOD4 motif-containing HNH endonuclease [Paludisphaera rhizosphaerae]